MPCQHLGILLNIGKGILPIILFVEEGRRSGLEEERRGEERSKGMCKGGGEEELRRGGEQEVWRTGGVEGWKGRQGFSKNGVCFHLDAIYAHPSLMVTGFCLWKKV